MINTDTNSERRIDLTIMILKQSLKNHLFVSGHIWVMTSIFILGWWYFNFDSDYLLVVGCFHLLFTLPAIYLHIEYFIRNRGQKITIEKDEIYISKNGEEYKYNGDDLAKISLYQSASMDSRGIPFTAMDYYGYLRIITKDGKEIIITCLMKRKLMELLYYFPDVPFARHKFAINSVILDKNILVSL